ncbi:S1 family peptidase [Pigmentibacter ruber]
MRDKKNPNPNGQICTGWVASNNLIITAAHCFKDDVAPYNDIFGISSIQLGFPKSESRGRHDIDIINTHKDWPNVNAYADIAFIKLKIGYEFNHAEIIPIYSKTKNIKHNDNVIAFGFTTNKFVDTSVIKPSDADLKTNGLTAAQAMESICVKDEMKPGDSGGPLYYLDNGNPFIIGILSSLNGCSANNSQTTYANIEMLIDWVEKESLVKIK